MDAQAPADRQQSKAIRKILLNHLPDLKESASDAYINNVVSILKSLLEDRVFQSKEQASEHFPDLFTRPPSEKSTENIPKKRKALSGRSINVAQVVQTEAIHKSSLGTTAGISILNRQGNGPFHVTLRPSAFSYNVQHHILSSSQQILEEACFRFMKRWLPSVLKKYGWTCAAAVKLTKWLCKNNEGRNRLEIIHLRVDAWVKNIDHDTEVMKQEAEHRVCQLELMLQTTIAQQQNKISLAAGQGLIESITSELGLHHPNSAAEVKGTLTCDEHAGNAGGIPLIDEDDIESDENRLQTEL
ncbi:hypothetical protein CC86DRAFT_433839 [Ophiobolus disseminans]|uniref:Uncharacterized protein n=1 Tax=Ophiobolus disseminans TaxID=1469910 RepID=A0A6A6ZB47_9PLEO|nr:hypothetical protein CC86DRAFT_433839 [Ophiobolus disseminans]